MCAGLMLVPVVVSLFTFHRHAHAAPAEDVTRRVRIAVAATAVGLAALGVAALVGGDPVPSVVTAAVLTGAVLAWAPQGRSWAVRGVVAWALLTVGAAAFLGWLLHRILTSSLSTGAELLAGAAWVVMVLALFRLRTAARGLVAARAETSAVGAVTAPGWGRQLVPLAALVTSAAVAVGVTALGADDAEPPAQAGPEAVPGPPSTGSGPPATSPPEPGTVQSGGPGTSSAGGSAGGSSGVAGLPPVDATAAAAGIGPRRGRPDHLPARQDRRSPAGRDDASGPRGPDTHPPPAVGADERVTPGDRSRKAKAVHKPGDAQRPRPHRDRGPRPRTDSARKPAADGPDKPRRPHVRRPEQAPERPMTRPAKEPRRQPTRPQPSPRVPEGPARPPAPTHGGGDVPTEHRPPRATPAPHVPDFRPGPPVGKPASPRPRRTGPLPTPPGRHDKGLPPGLEKKWGVMPEDAPMVEAPPFGPW